MRLYGDDTPVHLVVRSHFTGEQPTEAQVYVLKLLVNGVEHTSPIVDRSVLIAAARDIGEATLDFYLTASPQSGLCVR